MTFQSNLTKLLMQKSLKTL